MEQERRRKFSEKTSIQPLYQEYSAMLLVLLTQILHSFRPLFSKHWGWAWWCTNLKSARDKPRAEKNKGFWFVYPIAIPWRGTELLSVHSFTHTRTHARPPAFGCLLHLVSFRQGVNTRTSHYPNDSLCLLFRAPHLALLSHQGPKQWWGDAIS